MGRGGQDCRCESLLPPSGREREIYNAKANILRGALERRHHGRRGLGHSSLSRRTVSSKHDLRRPDQRLGHGCGRGEDPGIRDERQLRHEHRPSPYIHTPLISSQNPSSLTRYPLSKSIDGRFTASGHENGGIYIFNNETGRMFHSLPSTQSHPVHELPHAAKHLLRKTGLIKPIRAVTFSPRSTLLAATGDARIIALYDVASGEQIANLAGHGAWVMALDWSDTGEYLLSGYVCPLSLLWGRLSMRFG